MAMFHRDSTSKWKRVLGFDDGYPSAAPVNNPPPSPPYSNPDDFDDEKSEILLLPPPNPKYTLNFPRLPRDLTFTRTGRHDILLSPSSPAPSPNDIKPLPDPPPLFYFTNYENPSPPPTNPRPDLLFHSGPTNTSPIISYASFHSLSLITDITLCPLSPTTTSPSRSNSITTTNFSFPTRLSPGYGKPPGLKKPSSPFWKTEKLIPSGGIFTTEKHGFHSVLPRTSVREKFEWRHSSGPFVRTGEGVKETGGLKLVRCITGETVAVYAGLGRGNGGERRVVGMFRFLGERQGEEFDVMAVMTLVAVVERGRRAVRDNRIAMGIN